MPKITFEILFNLEKFIYFLFFTFKLKIANLLITFINVGISPKIQQC